jgi:hypothetical protein
VKATERLDGRKVAGSTSSLVGQRRRAQGHLEGGARVADEETGRHLRLTGLERPDQLRQPLGLQPHPGIARRYDVAHCRGDRHVAPAGDVRARFDDDTQRQAVLILAQHGNRVVARAAIDENDFVRLPRLLFERAQQRADRIALVEYGADYGNCHTDTL